MQTYAEELAHRGLDLEYESEDGAPVTETQAIRFVRAAINTQLDDAHIYDFEGYDAEHDKCEFAQISGLSKNVATLVLRVGEASFLLQVHAERIVGALNQSDLFVDQATDSGGAASGEESRPRLQKG